MEYYRAVHPDVRGRVEVREDFVGLMVSRGNLLVGSQLRVPRSRIEALVAANGFVGLIMLPGGQFKSIK